MKRLLAGALAALCSVSAGAVTLTTSIGPSDLRQRIDGFGTCLSGDEATQPWFQSLYLDDARFTIERMDLVPTFRSPYSDFCGSIRFARNITQPNPTIATLQKMARSGLRPYPTNCSRKKLHAQDGPLKTSSRSRFFWARKKVFA